MAIDAMALRWKRTWGRSCALGRADLQPAKKGRFAPFKAAKNDQDLMELAITNNGARLTPLCSCSGVSIPRMGDVNHSKNTNNSEQSCYHIYVHKQLGHLSSKKSFPKPFPRKSFEPKYVEQIK